MRETPGPSVRSSTGISTGSAPASFVSPPTLGALRRVPVWIGRDRRQVVSFGLQLVLNLLDCPIELLVFAFEFFRGIVIDYDVGIDATTFNDPLFAVF